MAACLGGLPREGQTVTLVAIDESTGVGGAEIRVGGTDSAAVQLPPGGKGKMFAEVPPTDTDGSSGNGEVVFATALNRNRFTGKAASKFDLHTSSVGSDYLIDVDAGVQVGQYVGPKDLAPASRTFLIQADTGEVNGTTVRVDTALLFSSDWSSNHPDHTLVCATYGLRIEYTKPDGNGDVYNVGDAGVCNSLLPTHHVSIPGSFTTKIGSIIHIAAGYSVSASLDNMRVVDHINTKYNANVAWSITVRDKFSPDDKSKLENRAYRQGQVGAATGIAGGVTTVGTGVLLLLAPEATIPATAGAYFGRLWRHVWRRVLRPKCYQQVYQRST